MITIRWLEERTDLGAVRGETRKETNETLAKEWADAGLCEILKPTQARKEAKREKKPAKVVAK